MRDRTESRGFHAPACRGGMREHEKHLPVWRQYARLFRGAAGLICRARWWATWELDQTHRLILVAILAPRPDPVKRAADPMQTGTVR